MLAVYPSGSKAWIQRLAIRGRRRNLGLGGYPVVTLKQAREVAYENRRIAAAGGDPQRSRDVPTFEATARALIDSHAQTWSPGGKSRRQWESSLAAYVYPRIGAKRVDEVTGADVMAVLQPIWTAKPETASRVRQRISAVMKWAIANQQRTDDPAGPAILQALPRRSRDARRHHPALPYTEVGDAVRRVQATNAWPGTKLAFEFLVLTAARSGEVRGARRDEIDAGQRIWTVPAARMKMRREHRVPLSARCAEIVEEAAELPSGGSELVFPSVRGRPMSDMTLSKLLRENGIAAVPHGFRSSFRDWAAERTNADHAVMEQALAHAPTDLTVAAYARSDLFEKRRALMDRWAAYVGDEPAEVIHLIPKEP